MPERPEDDKNRGSADANKKRNNLQHMFDKRGSGHGDKGFRGSKPLHRGSFGFIQRNV